MSLAYRPLSEVWFSSVQEMVTPPEGLRLPLWPKLTDVIGGLRLHELTLLCAPTGAGKTLLLACIAVQLALQKIPVFVAPVETGDSDFARRMISAAEGRNYNRGDAIRPEEVQRVTTKYLDSILKQHVYIASYDNRVHIDDMVNMLLYQYQTYGVKVALLDNLNFFLDVVSSQLEKAEMDEAIHKLVMLVKQIPIHIILIVHPRKTDGGRVLSEFDIKGSSTAVQECANVWLYNRPDPKEIEGGFRSLTDREAVFRKIRKRGENVGIPVWFGFENGTLREFV